MAGLSESDESKNCPGANVADQLKPCCCSNVSNYYYGVAAGESTRYAPYQLGSTVNYNAGLSFRYQLNKNWHLNGLVKYTQLDADIEDSPIVDSDNIATTMLSVSYQF